MRRAEAKTDSEKGGGEVGGGLDSEEGGGRTVRGRRPGQ